VHPRHKSDRGCAPEDYVAYAKSYKHQGAAAWLEDEGVFDSSDDIDIIPDSDDDDQF
jgi:hypothetical protein